jgi:hypothetical protein
MIFYGSPVFVHTVVSVKLLACAGMVDDQSGVNCFYRRAPGVRVDFSNLYPSIPTFTVIRRMFWLDGSVPMFLEPSAAALLSGKAQLRLLQDQPLKWR